MLTPLVLKEKQGLQTVHLFIKCLMAALKEQWRHDSRETEQVGTTVKHAEMK